ncbi:MAG: RNA polymerase sigma factor [Capsulimonadaceae bacterium]
MEHSTAMRTPLDIPSARGGVPEAPAWLDAARRGERWALESMYREHQPQVYALCVRVLGRTEDAEDATMTTFALAFQALPGFRGQSSLRTWLYRIAVNAATALLRKRRDEPPIDDNTGGQDPAGRMCETIAVRAALAKLRPEYRIILILRFWEDLAYDEIAEALRISMPATKMRLKRAREEFERVYEERP